VSRASAGALSLSVVAEIARANGQSLAANVAGAQLPSMPALPTLPPPLPPAFGMLPPGFREMHAGAAPGSRLGPSLAGPYGIYPSGGGLYGGLYGDEPPGLAGTRRTADSSQGPPGVSVGAPVIPSGSAERRRSVTGHPWEQVGATSCESWDVAQQANPWDHVSQQHADNPQQRAMSSQRPAAHLGQAGAPATHAGQEPPDDSPLAHVEYYTTLLEQNGVQNAATLLLENVQEALQKQPSLLNGAGGQDLNAIVAVAAQSLLNTAHKQRLSAREHVARRRAGENTGELQAVGVGNEVGNEMGGSERRTPAGRHPGGREAVEAVAREPEGGREAVEAVARERSTSARSREPGGGAEGRSRDPKKRILTPPPPPPLPPRTASLQTASAAAPAAVQQPSVAVQQPNLAVQMAARNFATQLLASNPVAAAVPGVLWIVLWN